MVTVESLIPGMAIFVLTNISGKQLYKENKQLSAGTNLVQITETSQLSKGTYLLTIIQSYQSQTIKVLKEN